MLQMELARRAAFHRYKHRAVLLLDFQVNARAQLRRRALDAFGQMLDAGREGATGARSRN